MKLTKYWLIPSVPPESYHETRVKNTWFSHRIFPSERASAQTYGCRNDKLRPCSTAPCVVTRTQTIVSPPQNKQIDEVAVRYVHQCSSPGLEEGESRVNYSNPFTSHLRGNATSRNSAKREYSVIQAIGLLGSPRAPPPPPPPPPSPIS